MPELPFPLFDADNHYYEAEDAFTRHVDRRMQRRCMQWAEIGGRRRLLVGGRVNRFIPNPTFDPVARPGCLDQYYRGRNTEGLDIRAAFGELEPINPAYRDRKVRLSLMDTQGLEGCFLFPTLGVGMEEALKEDGEAVRAAFRGFNEWLHEDWGYSYEERIFAAPYITLVDRDAAVSELERALDRDARVVVMRAAPVPGRSGSRSPADPHYDPFWARVDEAGITVAFHGGDSGYGRYVEDWGERSEAEAFRNTPLKGILIGNRAPYDLMAALVCHGLFQRFPNLRIASIEMGSFWVPWLITSFERAYGRDPKDFAEDPVETFRRHVWVAPFHEDDVLQLRELMGADRLLMGSDFPHAEGLPEPSQYVEDLEGFTPEEIRLVMRENALGLSKRRPA